MFKLTPSLCLAAIALLCAFAAGRLALGLGMAGLLILAGALSSLALLFHGSNAYFDGMKDGAEHTED